MSEQYIRLVSESGSDRGDLIKGQGEIKEMSVRVARDRASPPSVASAVNFDTNRQNIFIENINAHFHTY